ncbi:MAG TPA: DUF541 domain-containing protein [Gammaproteobacteria bacterium]|nr:DUF541 domain-containing protein [Gammaproteobacteria bacterium]
MRLIQLPLFLLSLLMAGNVLADDSVKNYNQISFDISVSRDVENDVMVASLFAQEEGSDAQVLSKRVNKSINQAIAMLEQHGSIQVSTRSYSTSPVYNKQKLVGWRVQQSIQLRSKDMALMSELIGKLQKELRLSGIAFSVSREKTAQVSKSLIDEALATFRQRAGQIASGLKADGYRIVSMRISGPDAPVVRLQQNMRVMAAQADVAPVLKAGENTLSVRVSGTIELE